MYYEYYFFFFVFQQYIHKVYQIFEQPNLEQLIP